jgi:glycerol transport system ATP-binding protein
MKVLKLENVWKYYRGRPVLKNISLEIKSGQFFSLLGPTGSGKTTLLKVIAGLEKPDKGRIYLDGEDITEFPPSKRKVSFVFQTFALYPTMSVYENIAAPLKNQKVSTDEINRRVKKVTEILGISHLLSRSVMEISGGEAQRTAFARALVKDFSILLMDEPLTNVDYKIRERMRVELKKLYYSLIGGGNESIWVYATPDPREALALSTHIAVLHNGEILQSGPSLEVYYNPSHILVAGYISYPWLNRIKGRVVQHASGEYYINIDDKILLKANKLKESSMEVKECILGIRPSCIRLSDQKSPDDIEMKSYCKLVEISGSETILHLTVGSQDLVALIGERLGSEIERTEINIYVSPRDIFIFSPEGKFMTKLM